MAEIVLIPTEKSCWHSSYTATLAEHDKAFKLYDTPAKYIFYEYQQFLTELHRRCPDNYKAMLIRDIIDIEGEDFSVNELLYWYDQGVKEIIKIHSWYLCLLEKAFMDGKIDLI